MKKLKMMKLGMFALTMLLAGTAFAQSSKLKSAVKDDFVTISGGRLDPYMIMKTEVPQWMYKEVMGDNPSKWKNNNNPAESMGVYNAIAFCNKLSMMMGLTPVYTVKGSTNPSHWGAMPRKDDEDWKKIKVNKDANGFRFPTSEEWVYAAREGTRESSYEYSGSNDPDRVAWYYNNSVIDRTRQPHNVGKKSPNALGIYDMSGNVAEFVHGDTDYTKFMMNGGSYDFSESSAKAKPAGSVWTFGSCSGVTGIFDRDNFGIRLVRTVTESDSSSGGSDGGEADILLYTGDSMRVSVSGGTKWKSSDKSVVTVNSQGKVVAVGAGTAILKSNKGKTLTVMVEGDDDDWDDEDW